MLREMREARCSRDAADMFLIHYILISPIRGGGVIPFPRLRGQRTMSFAPCHCPRTARHSPVECVVSKKASANKLEEAGNGAKEM